MNAALYVVATPIGNLEDLTLRALRVLREAHVLLAEDTRHVRVLLDHHAIVRAPAISCHEHNESERVGLVLGALREGRSVALVTDAGTPGISDPGYRLVAAVREAGLAVVPVPGACAAVAALSASGMATARFTFVGFAPKKAGARRTFLDALGSECGTVVLYAAARDVPALLAEVADERAVVVFREITKQFEECLRGTASQLRAEWERAPRKGECVVLLDRTEPVTDEVTDDQLLAMMKEHRPSEVAKRTGVSRQRVYALLRGPDSESSL